MGKKNKQSKKGCCPRKIKRLLKDIANELGIKLIELILERLLTVLISL